MSDEWKAVSGANAQAALALVEAKINEAFRYIHTACLDADTQRLIAEQA